VSPVQQRTQQPLAKTLRPVNHHPAGLPLTLPHTVAYSPDDGLDTRREGHGQRKSLAVSEFGQLGARRHDPHAARTEIHHQRGVNLDPDDPAEAVPIVGDLIPHGELLSRRSGGWGTEGTGGQVAPSRGAGSFHHYQYAPADSMRLRG